MSSVVGVGSCALLSSGATIGDLNSGKAVSRGQIFINGKKHSEQTGDIQTKNIAKRYKMIIHPSLDQQLSVDLKAKRGHEELLHFFIPDGNGDTPRHGGAGDSKWCSCI